MFKGLEDAGVLSCAKHFPGHGDTDKDSHYTLPVLEHDKYRLDDVELFPFRRLAAQNIGSIMVGHLYLSKVETDVNRPASLSRTIITGMLREELSYRGLILTDGLDMKAITKIFHQVLLKLKRCGREMIFYSFRKIFHWRFKR